MRKFLLFLFLIYAKMTFAQEKGEISFSHPCFKQLEITVKNHGYQKDNKAYGWGIKIKNNYKTAVSFTYKLVVGNENSKNVHGQPTDYINPGQTFQLDWGTLYMLLKNSNSNEFEVPIWGLCFKGYDCSGENYFDCDGKQLKDKLFGSDWRTKNNQNNNQTNNSSNNNNYNTTTNLVNRLNELCPQLGKLTNGASNSIYTGICNGKTYTANDINLLKSHIVQLENEITRLQNSNSQKQIEQQQNQQVLQQQQNQKAQQAEQQRIAQENARRAEEERKQQYNNSVNQAQNNMQNGNYSGAMQGYANAASSAGSKSEKQLATGGTIISGLTGLADVWQKSSKEKQERKLQEAKAELKKAEDDAKKAKDEMERKEDEQKKKEEIYKVLFENLKPLPIDSIKVKDAVTVQSIINKHIKAIGGLEKLKAVKNITKSTEGKILPAETYYKNKSIIAYGKFVTNIAYNNEINSNKTVFNGVTGYRESNNKKTNLDSESITMSKKTQPIDILKLQENADLELEKQIVLFGSKECYAIIERSKQDSNVKKHYFSRDSGLCLGIESVITRPNYSSTHYFFYEDYREVDGVLFSFSQNVHYQYLGFNSEYHYGLSNTEITEIKINEPLTDKDFE